MMPVAVTAIVMPVAAATAWSGPGDHLGEVLLQDAEELRQLLECVEPDFSRTSSPSSASGSSTPFSIPCLGNGFRPGAKPDARIQPIPGRPARAFPAVTGSSFAIPPASISMQRRNHSGSVRITTPVGALVPVVALDVAGRPGHSMMDHHRLCMSHWDGCHSRNPHVR